MERRQIHKVTLRVPASPFELRQSEVEVRIDLDRLARNLLDRAATNKRKAAKALGGAIHVRVLSETLLPRDKPLGMGWIEPPMKVNQ